MIGNGIMNLSVPYRGVGRCLGHEGNGVSSGVGVREGQTPETSSEISSQTPARKEATWSRRKKARRAGLMRRTQRAQSEDC
jgi:hypothetical protein